MRAMWTRCPSIVTSVASANQWPPVVSTWSKNQSKVMSANSRRRSLGRWFRCCSSGRDPSYPRAARISISRRHRSLTAWPLTNLCGCPAMDPDRRSVFFEIGAGSPHVPQPQSGLLASDGTPLSPLYTPRAPGPAPSSTPPIGPEVYIKGTHQDDPAILAAQRATRSGLVPFLSAKGTHQQEPMHPTRRHSPSGTR